MPTTLTLTLGLQALAMRTNSTGDESIGLFLLLGIMGYLISFFLHDGKMKEIEEEQITPQSIERAEFWSQGRGGANRTEVRAYLKRVSAELEHVSAERDELQAKVAELEGLIIECDEQPVEITEYDGQEHALDETGESQDAGTSSRVAHRP